MPARLKESAASGFRKRSEDCIQSEAASQMGRLELGELRMSS